MKIGLIGATGLVGEAVLQQLLNDDSCSQIRVWARSPGGDSAEKLNWHKVDFEQLSDEIDCQGLDLVLCCLGTTTAKAGKAGLERVDLDYVMACAQSAKAAGVENFAVISSLGANASSPVHYSRTKGRMEAALVATGFECLNILRPSLLMGPRREHRPGEALGQRMAPLLNFLLLGPLKRYRPIEANQVAQAMIQVGKAAEPGVHIRFLPLPEKV